MTGFKIRHNNITQQCNFDVQLTSSALNQLRKHCLLAKETFGGVLVLWGRPKNSPAVKQGGTIGHCRELCSGPISCPWGWFMSRGQSFGVYIRFSVCSFEQLLLHLSDWAAPAEVQAEAKAEDFHPPRRSQRGTIRCYGLGGRDAATTTHARVTLGWRARQRRQGGPALFTPTAVCTSLFKQNGCLYKLPLSPADVIKWACVDVVVPDSNLDGGRETERQRPKKMFLKISFRWHGFFISSCYHRTPFIGEIFQKKISNMLIILVVREL